MQRSSWELVIYFINSLDDLLFIGSIFLLSYLLRFSSISCFFFLNDPAPPETTSLPQHDPLPICVPLPADNTKFIDAYELGGKPQARTTDRPFATPPTRTMSADGALAAVLASVGATLPVRDPVEIGRAHV